MTTTCSHAVFSQPSLLFFALFWQVDYHCARIFHLLYRNDDRNWWRHDESNLISIRFAYESICYLSTPPPRINASADWFMISDVKKRNCGNSELRTAIIERKGIHNAISEWDEEEKTLKTHDGECSAPSRLSLYNLCMRETAAEGNKKINKPRRSSETWRITFWIIRRDFPYIWRKTSSPVGNDSCKKSWQARGGGRLEERS